MGQTHKLSLTGKLPKEVSVFMCCLPVGEMLKNTAKTLAHQKPNVYEEGPKQTPVSGKSKQAVRLKHSVLFSPLFISGHDSALLRLGDRLGA